MNLLKFTAPDVTREKDHCSLLSRAENALVKMEHSKFIRKKLSELTKVTVCSETLLDVLLEAGILHDSDVSVLYSVQKENTRIIKLWRLIEQKNVCLSTLSKVFEDLNQQDVVSILSSIVPARRRNTFLDDLKPFPVSVIRPTKHIFNEDDEYNLVSDVIGLALIINITEYDDASMKRSGTEQDTIYMSDLWGQLGYNVKKYEGRYTSDDVDRLLKIFCKKFERFENLQSCVVFIGCHGKVGKLIFSDQTELSLYSDVVLKFNGDQQKIKSKPKLFIIQSCAQVLQLKADNEDWNKLSHTTVCVSSFHETNLGSYYLYVLTDVIMREAYRLSWTKILKEASRNLYQVLEPQKITECYPHHHFFNMKTLYFNVEPTGVPQDSDLQIELE